MLMRRWIACPCCTFFVIIAPPLSRHSGSVTRLAMLFRRLPLFVSGLFALGLHCFRLRRSRADSRWRRETSTTRSRTPTARSSASTRRSTRHVILPAAKAYRWAVIPPMRQSFHDFMQNLNAPVVFANDVLQGQLGLASQTFGRIAINSTMGFGGMFDFATAIRHPLSCQRFRHHAGDLGHSMRARISSSRCSARPTRATPSA